MNVTLEAFEIANGVDRTTQVLATEEFALRQETQVSRPSRAAWIRGHHSRAARSIALSYPVTFPPCESQEEAVLQSRQIPIQCPRGGELVEYYGGIRNTYADAWIEGDIQVMRIGVTNRFTFNLTAVDPTTVSLVLDEESGILEDEEGGELEY